MDLEEVYQPGSALDMPKRPSWNYNMSKAQLEVKEEQYFRVSTKKSFLIIIILLGVH